MNILVIGDVHGCYHTFKKLLDQHWDKKTERVIQIGDLIDRGANSPQTVEFARNLREACPNQAFFLKGNHEFEIIEHFLRGPNENWHRQCGEETLNQYQQRSRSVEEDVAWFQQLPLFWENEHVFISHAGVSKQVEIPFDEDDPFGLLWNRSPLKNIEKLQIIGHTPCENPVFDEESNTWNIDTGAAFSGYRHLTGLKVKPDGEIIAFVNQETDEKDISRSEETI